MHMGRAASSRLNHWPGYGLGEKEESRRGQKKGDREVSAGEHHPGFGYH